MVARLIVILWALTATALCQSQQGTLYRVGDGGPAIKAEIDGPSSIAVDPQGNLYVNEQSGGAVRRIDAVSHIITTVVKECSTPWKKPRQAGCVGPIAELRIGPSGNLLFTEFTYNLLKAFDLRTHMLSLIAGNGDLRSSGNGGPAIDAGLSAPNGFTFDSKGDIIVCDSGHYIRRISAATGLISTLAGSGRRGGGGDAGPALDAEFTTPLSVAVDSSNNIYVADDTSNRIRRVDGATGIIEPVAGSGPPITGSFFVAEFRGEGGPATSARLTAPRSLAFDQDGNLLFIVGGRVCQIDKQGKLKTIAGVGLDGFSGDGGPATSARISPVAIAVDVHGNLFIADYGNNRIRRVDANSGVIKTVAGNGLPHHPPQGVM